MISLSVFDFYLKYYMENFWIGSRTKNVESLIG